VTGPVEAIPNSTPTNAAERVWMQQSIWSQVANNLKTGVDHLRALALALTIVAAVLATAAAQVSSVSNVAGRVLALSAAIVVALVPLVRSRASRQTLLDWTTARSVSEALKTDIYTFLSGTTPYRSVDRDQLLIDNMNERVGTIEDGLIRALVGVSAQVRPMPAVNDIGTYLERRVDHQINWYRSTAKSIEQRVTLLRRAETVLAVVAAVLSAVAATFEIHQASAWVSVITTITAALIAHATAARYEYQVTEYQRTALTLEQLRFDRSRVVAPSPADDDRFVDQCESVIAKQHQAWVGKWTSGDPL